MPAGSSRRCRRRRARRPEMGCRTWCRGASWRGSGPARSSCRGGPCPGPAPMTSRPQSIPMRAYRSECNGPWKSTARHNYKWTSCGRRSGWARGPRCRAGCRRAASGRRARPVRLDDGSRAWLQPERIAAKEAASSLLAEELVVLHDQLAARQDVRGSPDHRFTLVGGVVGAHVQVLVRELEPLLRIPNDQIGVSADAHASLAWIEPEDLGRRGGGDLDETVHRNPSRAHRLPHYMKTRLGSKHPV